MAWVETRITRTSQPQDACGLDTNHPLFSKISLAWTPKSQIFAAGQSGKGVQSSAAAPSVSAGSRGVFENQGQNGIEIPVSRVQANNGFSVLYIGGHSSPNWSVCLETSSGAFRRWSGLYALMTPSGRRTVSSSPIPAGAVVVAGMLSTSVFRMLVNGVSVVNLDLSGGDSIGPTATVQVFQSSAGDRSSATYWNSPAALLVGFDTYLSETEAKSLSDNPWQIFEPEIVRIWVDDYVSAGGGATVIPIGVQATGSVGTPSVTGAANALPAGVSATASVGTPVAVGGSSIPATALPAGIAASSAVGTPVATGAAVALPAGVSASSAVGVPVAIAGTSIPATVLPTGVQAFGAVGTPTVTAAAIAQPLGVAAIAYVGTPTIATGVSGVAVAYPAGVQAIGQVGTLIATGAAWTAAVGVQAVASVGTPSAYAGIQVIYTPGAQTRPSRLQSSSRPSRIQTGTRASR